MRIILLLEFIIIFYLSSTAIAFADNLSGFVEGGKGFNSRDGANCSRLESQSDFNFVVPSRLEQSLENSASTNATETKLLIPLYQCPHKNHLLYLDLRGELDNSTSKQFDTAIGYRKLLNNTNFLKQNQWILGAYAAIGRSYTRYKNSFQQESFGIEALSEDYDFRVNYYLVQEKEKRVGDDKVSESEDDLHHYTTTYSLKQTALTGIDLEFGYKLPTPTINTKIYLGTYFYQQPNHHQTTTAIYDSFSKQGYNSINGQKLRLELKLDHTNLKHLNKNLSLTFSTEYTHDSLNQGQIFTIAKISYQFGFNQPSTTSNQLPANDLHNRMNEFTVRHYVVTDTSDAVASIRSDKGDGGDGDSHGDGDIN